MMAQKSPPQLMEKLQRVSQFAQEALRQAQCQQKKKYDKWVKIQEFSTGQNVQILLTDSESKLLKKWQGSFEMV